MPEAFKNKFSVQIIEHLGRTIKEQLPEFAEQDFVRMAADNFDKLELKQRSLQITQALHEFMPQSYQRCDSVIRTILHPENNSSMNDSIIEKEGVRGWLIMPLADFVSLRAIPQHFDKGMALLQVLTSRFSSEFAIRDFLIFDWQRALEILTTWSGSDNHHVRRLVSEGTRPRLPWGKRLKVFVDDPKPLRPLLVSLLDDSEEYVRRSVANNLNDIAKDNPDFVVDFVAEFLPDADTNRFRLLKHGCRTLLKQGHPDILAHFGFLPFNGNLQLTLMQSKVQAEGDLLINLELSGNISEPQKLMLDYVIWYQKANGKLTPKVFKWKLIEQWLGESLHLQKRHSFKSVTTRKHYPSEHRVEIQLNGEILAKSNFELTENGL